MVFKFYSSLFFMKILFSMKILLANRIAPDGTPRSAASHLGYVVCLCPTKGTPGLDELSGFSHDVTIGRKSHSQNEEAVNDIYISSCCQLQNDFFYVVIGHGFRK